MQSVAGVVPAFATAVLVIAAPAAVSLLLLAVFGRETRGRDLSELDATGRMPERSAVRAGGSAAPPEASGRPRREDAAGAA